jgi:hypothetical protein
MRAVPGGVEHVSQGARKDFSRWRQRPNASANIIPMQLPLGTADVGCPVSSPPAPALGHGPRDLPPAPRRRPAAGGRTAARRAIAVVHHADLRSDDRGHPPPAPATSPAVDTGTDCGPHTAGGNGCDRADRPRGAPDAAHAQDPHTDLGHGPRRLAGRAAGHPPTLGNRPVVPTFGRHRHSATPGAGTAGCRRTSPVT